MLRHLAVALLTLAALALQGCAHSPVDDPRDPLEGANRAVFQFNLKADKYVMQPIARGYVDVVPAFARRGITNFFSNLGYPKVIVNDLLQAKFLQGGQDLGRFLLNSTAGLAGFLDVATDTGLPKHDEDFGQTLGYWGVGPGWFLMLPFLGPSDNRDLVGFTADTFLSPTYYVPSTYDAEKYGTTAVHLVNKRANLLGTEGLLNAQFDPYIFVRTAYLSQRRNLVYDGNPPQQSLDDELELPPDDDTPATGASVPAPPSSSP